MRVVTSVRAMARRARGWRREGSRVGFVPTMGYLHDGHLSLVRRARREVGESGVVVVSIYVNPTQFGPGEDLKRYPRDFRRDRALCREVGVDVIFAPSDQEMYGAEPSTFVAEEGLSRGMEGASRPTHFRGVCTVVTKLFNLVQPELAVFGEKDWQQAAVIQRMVRDLNLPLRIVVAPTSRESDGLAMSSRNARLSEDERAQAVVLSQAIHEARRRVRASAGGLPAAKLCRELTRWVERQPLARVDYIEFFDPATLRPVSRVGRGARMGLAVWMGTTRLIDNGRL
jgi:pantoate--beta-alanine ligase